MKPTAWYDSTNGAVSTDKDSPLFTPLGQLLPLYTQRTWAGSGDLEDSNAYQTPLAAQPEQEPVAWLMYKGTHKDSFWLDKEDAYNFEMTPEHRWEPLYTAPPQRTEPPAWFPAVENILNEYGLQAIDFVADFKAAMKDAEQSQRTWVGLMRGVRVEGDTVVITVKGGNDAARELCGNLLNEMEARG